MSSLLATAQRYLDALTALEADRLAALLAPEYEHTFAPSSAAFGPPVGRDVFVERFVGLRPVLSGMTNNILQSWPNDAGRTITIFARMSPIFHEHIKQAGDQKDEWTFCGEYMFVLTADEIGEKVTKSFEFVESKMADRMKAQIGKAFQRISSRA
jgi:hypothetical protein